MPLDVAPSNGIFLPGKYAALSEAATAAHAGAKPRTSLGILTYCFNLAQAERSRVPGVPDFRDPVAFVTEAARIGASAVQLSFGVRDADYITRLRNAAAENGVALEGTLPLPKTDLDISRFEAEIKTLRELGVKIARTVLFPGRRYEDLKTLAAYKEAASSARAQLRRAEPIARAAGVKLAVENHKDQRIDERVKLFEEFGGEFVGACVDVGNNIALLEDPVEVCRALGPWALTVHFKDQGVREYEDGFLLADVPLGKGCIDLPEVIRVLKQKRPTVVFQLELITRDPLKVPILTESYWATFPDLKAATLASAWNLVKKRGSPTPFEMISTLTPAQKVAAERRNVEESFQFAADHLGFRL